LFGGCSFTKQRNRMALKAESVNALTLHTPVNCWWRLFDGLRAEKSDLLGGMEASKQKKRSTSLVYYPNGAS